MRFAACVRGLVKRQFASYIENCRDQAWSSNRRFRGAELRFLRGRYRMLCPYCRKSESKVIDSRTSGEFEIRRRRECLNRKCGRRYTTYERLDLTPPNVIKKDGSRVPFERDKIRSGLEKACFKRPVSAEQIERIIDQVEADIFQNFEREVPSRHIGERVFDMLREVDQVAFVRFASVYREFKDVKDFVEELEPMLRESNAAAKRRSGRVRSRIDQ